MGWGGGDLPRLDPWSLNLDRSLRDRISKFAVEHKDGTGRWTTVGFFGRASDAADHIDLSVSMGRGLLSDYRIRRVGYQGWLVIVGWTTLSLAVLAAIAFWVALATP